MIAPLLALLLHGGSGPQYWLDPEGVGICGAPWPNQHVRLVGAQELMQPSGWYYGHDDWYPYVVLNGHGTPQFDLCWGAFFTGYLSAGNLGEPYSIALRRYTVLAGEPIPEDAIAWVTWADSWVPPYYSGFGWSMLDPASESVAHWIFTDEEKTYTLAASCDDPAPVDVVQALAGAALAAREAGREFSGLTRAEIAQATGRGLSEVAALDGLEFFGWQRLGTWPDDARLDGLRRFYQGFALDPQTGEVRFSATWSVIFTAPMTAPSTMPGESK